MKAPCSYAGCKNPAQWHIHGRNVDACGVHLHTLAAFYSGRSIPAGVTIEPVGVYLAREKEGQR